jgi:succinoglycan biosynthesis transport protein ExoP
MSTQLQLLPLPEPRFYRHTAANAPMHGDAMTSFSDDLKSGLAALRRHAGIFVAAFVCVLVAALAWIYYSVPIYSAKATIVLDSPRQVVPNSPSVLADVEPDSTVVDTQVQVIQSRVVLGRAVDRLGLLEAVEGPTLTRDDVIDTVRRNLSVVRVGLSHALSIAYQDEDAEAAASTANAIAAAYLDHQLEVKQQATKDANQWLSQGVEELGAQVAAAETAVDRYRARAGLLVAKGATSTESELTDLDVALSGARRDLSDAEARLGGYRGALARFGPANAAEVVATPMMQQLRTQYGSLINQKAQFSPALGALHPQMVELNRQIAGLQEQMNAEAQRTVEELKTDVVIAENKVSGLLAIRDQSRTRLVKDNSASIELAQLQTNAESVRKIYEAMLTRLTQTTSQETLGQVSATIVSEAIRPTAPDSPKPMLIIAVAVALGLALGAFAVLLAQLFDKTIVRPEEFERRTQVPLLAMVPQLRRRDLKVGGTAVPIADFVLGKPTSHFAESFRNLRVAVLDSVDRQGAVVVQITSGTFAEGKTVCSIAFARTAAIDGKRVLLIDADVRRRSLTESLGIVAEAGLIEVLRGEAELRDVLIPGSATRGPHVLPLSASDAGSYDVFSTKAFESLLGRLKKGFDLIVIDSAPILAIAEPLSLAKRVDVVVVVARWAKTPIEIVQKALEEIRRAGGNVAGTVLTHVDTRKVSRSSYGRKYYPALMRYYRQ